MFLKPFLNIVCSVAGSAILLKETNAIKQYCCSKVLYLVCNRVKVGGSCQSNINARASVEPLHFFSYSILFLSPSQVSNVHTPGYPHDAKENIH